MLRRSLSIANRLFLLTRKNYFEGISKRLMVLKYAFNVFIGKLFKLDHFFNVTIWSQHAYEGQVEVKEGNDNNKEKTIDIS